MGWLSRRLIGGEDDSDRVIAEAERIAREAAEKRKKAEEGQ